MMIRDGYSAAACESSPAAAISRRSHSGEMSKPFRPGRCAEFEKHTSEIIRVTQRLDQRAGFLHHLGKVVHAFAAVREAHAHAEAAEFFQLGDLSQHRALRSVRAGA